MKIKSFKIKNFKSIEELIIPLANYGNNKSKSSAAFLVGLNESGKSSILEAIYLWHEGLDEVDYEDYFHKGSDDGDICIEAELEIENIRFYQKKITELLKIDEATVTKVNITSLTKIVWQNEQDNGTFYSTTIDSNFPFYKYIYSKERGIQSIKGVNSINGEITQQNVESYLKEGQVLLTKEDLEKQICLNMASLWDKEIPIVSMWAPEPEYLINEVIDLKAFIVNPNISVPLKNILRINGVDTNEKIKSTIEKALLKPENKAELQTTFSKTTTIYVNKIWKEHKINIVVNIDGNNCSVHIEDKDKAHKYYSMNQRSDGFNQFISLILSLSTQNDSNELRDNIILLDEPEIHLHPSGVRYMRDELLKIGKNNILFVSTHSHYMVDTNTPERHFIVSKKQMKTEIVQIKEDVSMSDDQVLASAFGISLFKELLPQNIIIVEGGDDKAIISHSLNLLFENFFYSIKSAGGTSKVYGIASILAQEKVPAYIILDDDKDGRDIKREILYNLKENYTREKVFTLKDVSPTLIDKGTIEDTLPQKFVKDFFEKEMGHSFEFNRDLPILIQIKNQDESLKNNKEQLNSKKIGLSELFIKTYNSKKSIELEAPNLVTLLNGLIQRLAR